MRYSRQNAQTFFQRGKLITFSGYRRRTQKHALTCDDATPKIASYPGAPDCRGRHLFFCSGSKYFGWSG